MSWAAVALCFRLGKTSPWFKGILLSVICDAPSSLTASGKHSESDQARHLATQVIAQWSRNTQNQFKARVHAIWKPFKRAFVKWRKWYYLKLKELEIRYRPVRMWVDKHTMLEHFFRCGLSITTQSMIFHAVTCQTGISLSTTELSALCKDNVRTLVVLY